MSPSTRSILSKFMGFVKPTNYLHGLIRGENMELGTGSQVKYVVVTWTHYPLSKVLGEQVGGGYPVAIHGHYADAGDSAARLSSALNEPMLFTGSVEIEKKENCFGLSHNVECSYSHFNNF
ncbi:hypothetical protein L1887_09189 [Cichorium endivia]|nr:hypothetical protein L1887_09189 [Cichorium endivia]